MWHILKKIVSLRSISWWMGHTVSESILTDTRVIDFQIFLSIVAWICENIRTNLNITGIKGRTQVVHDVKISLHVAVGGRDRTITNLIVIVTVNSIDNLDDQDAGAGQGHRVNFADLHVPNSWKNEFTL